jgi:hypothetical protein
MEGRIRASMKNLAEKKLLVSMMQALGQPVDPALIESIRLEEELTAKLFPQQQVMVEEIEEEVVEVQPEVLIEASPPQPPSPFPIDPEPPTAKDLVAKSVEAITKFKPSTQTSSKPTLQETELQYIRRQLEDIQKRYSTLAWGSGGGGSVLIRDMSDFVNSSVGVGKYMTWNNGMFYMDDVNTNEVTYNTTLVTTATYTAQSGDYYIGVNYAGPVTITLPAIGVSGRNLIIKDESGNCENNAITITGTIDNDAGGVILQINNGAIDLIFRDGWRII